MSTPMSAADADLSRLDRPSPWSVFRLTAIAVFLVSLDATVVLAAFPALRAAFPAASPAELSWVINAYTIVYAALLVPAGRLADIHGRKRLFLIGLSGFGLGSLLCALAPGPMSLIAARALQAAGASLLTPASLALILEAFPASKRAVAVSLWGAVGAMAAAVGPALGAWLIVWTSWPWVFLINVPIVAWAGWRCRARLVESVSPGAGARTDGVGIALVVAAVALMVLGLVQLEHWPLRTSLLVSGAGAALLGAFVFWVRGRESGALDLRLFADRSYRWINVATFVFGAAFTMMFLAFFLFLTGVWRYPLGWAGLAVTPGPLAVVPTAVLAGRLAARLGHRPLLVAGAAVFAASNLWFLARLGAEPAFLATWLPGMLLGGIGVGLVLPALSGAAVASLRPQQFGIGNATNSAIRQIGSAFGAAATVLMVGDPSSGLSAFHTVYATLAVGGVLTGLACLPVDTRPGARATPAAPSMSDPARR